MQRQTAKLVVGAVFVFGLLGISVHLALSQDTGEATGAPAVRTLAVTGVTTSTQNPLQIALLHWYKANQTTQFATGSNAIGVAFDGASIWVCNFGSSNVTKLRGSDSHNLGIFPAGTKPIAAAFDGANIWVANIGSANVTKL